MQIRHTHTRAHVPWPQLALVLLVVVCTTAALYVAAASRQLLLVAETLPMLLYCALAGVTLMPTAVLHRPSRHFFANTCKRVLLPLQVRRVGGRARAACLGGGREGQPGRFSASWGRVCGG